MLSPNANVDTRCKGCFRSITQEELMLSRPSAVQKALWRAIRYVQRDRTPYLSCCTMQAITIDERKAKHVNPFAPATAATSRIRK